MEVSLSTDNWLIAPIVILLVTTIPVKLGASLVGTSNTSIGACAIAVVLGILSTMVIFNTLKGFISLIALFISLSEVYWLVLKPSFIASFGLTILVMLIQLGVIQGLSKIGAWVFRKQNECNKKINLTNISVGKTHPLKYL